MGISVYTSLLLKDHKRKRGEVIALRKELRELSRAVLERQTEVAALEVVLRSRLPDFDPASVKPIATQPKLAGLKHNKLTTLILDCLREEAPDPVPKLVIDRYVAERRHTDEPTREQMALLAYCIKKRLKGMAASCRVIRHHDKTKNLHGIWSLPEATASPTSHRQ